MTLIYLVMMYRQTCEQRPPKGKTKYYGPYIQVVFIYIHIYMLWGLYSLNGACPC